MDIDYSQLEMRLALSHVGDDAYSREAHKQAHARRRAEALTTYGDVIMDIKEEQRAMQYAIVVSVRRRAFMFGMGTGALVLYILQRFCLWYLQ